MQQWRPAFHVLLALTLLWTVGNMFYVYVVLQGSRIHRVESAAIVLGSVGAALSIPRWRYWPRVPESPQVLRRAAMFSVLVLWLLKFAPLWNYPFLSDDYIFLELYQSGSDLGRAPQFFRPFCALVFFALSEAGDQGALAIASSSAAHLTTDE